MKIFQLFILVSLLALSSFKPVDHGRLVVVIEGIKEPKGELILAVFNNESDFLKKEFKSQKVKVDDSGKVLISFDDLPKGNYSISVIHDENLNGKLDKNFVGIPKEGFGFSNNKMGTFGPPSFKDCEIVLAQDKLEINIMLKHM